MNVAEEKKYITSKLNEGERRIDLTYWADDNPQSHQLIKLKEFAESKGCSVVVVDGYSYPKGLRITNLLTHKR